LGGINYPLLSDFFPHGQVAQAFGVLRPEGYTERAIFVIDRQGIIRYADVHDISQQPDNEELFRVLSELLYQTRIPSADAALDSPEIKLSRKARILNEQTGVAMEDESERIAEMVMYCTPWCPDCRQARAYLNEHGVQYVEVNIFRDREAAQQVRNWTGGFETTPTFNIHGTIVVDFQKDKIAHLLGISS
jgi:glutaredoxin